MGAEELILTVQIVKATNLPNVEKGRDASDPYAIIKFKSKKVKSEVIDKNNNPEWNETKELEIGQTALAPGDVLDVTIKDHEKIGSDRTMAQCKVPLKDCLTNPSVNINQPLLDAKNKKLDNSFITLVLNYSGAKKKGGGGGASATGGAVGAAAAGGGGGGDADPGEYSPEAAAAADFAEPVVVVDASSSDAGVMPDEQPLKMQKKKESLRGTLPKKAMDYQVRVKVWEARQLRGGGIKPVTKVRVSSQTKSTKVKSSESPFWGETFFFNFNMIPVELFDEIISLEVCNSKKLRSDALIGSFKLDIGMVWDEPHHAIQKKWLMLTDPNSESGEMKGYLKISAIVLGAGDEAPPEASADGNEDDDDIESNLLRPAGTMMRPATFWIRLYKGEDIPQMDVGAFTKLKGFFTGEETSVSSQVDPFIICKFAGKRVKSSVHYSTNNPEFNQQLQIKFNFPSMCQKLKFDLRDWDQIGGDDPIAMAEIDLSTISVNGEAGFLPTYGPCWLNFYGAPREEGKETLGGTNEKLNEGKGEGCAFRGRVLIEMGTILDKKPDAAVVPIDDDQLLTIDKWFKTRKWRLFALFEEANMFTDEIDEAVHFEVSMGNFGNSMDPDSPPMPSTTPATSTVTDGKFYHYMPIGENKPIVCLDCDFEDVSNRLGVVNMMEKLIEKLQRQLDDLVTKNELLPHATEENQHDEEKGVAMAAIAMLRTCKDEMPNIIAKLEHLVHPGNPSREGNNLDLQLTKHRIGQLKAMLAKAITDHDTASDVDVVIDAGQTFLEALRNLAIEPQLSMPDVIVWLMEDTKRIAYLRVPAKDIFYHNEESYRGRFCSVTRNIVLKYPGKKQEKEYKIPSQVRLKMWFGLQKDDKAWLRDAVEAKNIVVAETVQFGSYSPLTKWGKSKPEYADLGHDVALPKEGFQPPEGWEFDGDWYIARDKGTQIDPEDGLDAFTEDVFESEWRVPYGTWASDYKKPWVNVQNGEMPARDDIKPPPGWAWEDGSAWKLDSQRAVDEEGWEYCLDLDMGGWTASQKPFHTWRRRRWVRERKRLPDADAGSKLRSAAPEEDEGWEYGKTYSSKFHKIEASLDQKRRRRWHRKIKRVSDKAPPVFFFNFPLDNDDKKKGEVKIAPRSFASFSSGHKYELRAYIFQARDVLAADDEGYSDPYCRVAIGNRSQKTIIQNLTVNPTWNQTLIFKNLVFYDAPEELQKYPPNIVVELFDFDTVGSDDFLGRTFIQPKVRLGSSGEKTELDWFPISHFGEPAGELLAAFDLHLADPGIELPYEPTKNEHNNYIVPSGIAPETQNTCIEFLCWGVRDMQSYQLLSVDKPSMEFEIGDVTVKTTSTISMKTCPNFKQPVYFKELQLPVKEKYTPPMNIKVRDKRAFGRVPVVASSRLKTLSDYRIQPIFQTKADAADVELAQPVIPALKMGETRQIVKSVSMQSLSQTAAGVTPVVVQPRSTDDVSITVERKTSVPTPEASKDPSVAGDSAATASTGLLPSASGFGSGLKGMMGGLNRPALPPAKAPRDEIVDWWTKFYGSHSDEKSIEKAKEYLKRGGDTVHILDRELEEIKGLEFLQDFCKTFRLDKGKKRTDEEGEYMGQFKGALVMYPISRNPDDPKPKKYFSDVPDAQPKEVVVRVYIIKATGLQPMDDNGKADPYIMIECGKQKIKDDENYLPGTLDPVFGKMFELTVTLPKEKDLKISIWDWDVIGKNDLIGMTTIDLEDRYLTRHRATCGIPQSYKIKGFNVWRDCQKPKEILEWYCKKNLLAPPTWNSETEVVVNNLKYQLDMFELKPPEPIDEFGEQDERLALHVLNQLDIVKEHVERRGIQNPAQPDLDQGQVYMWVDMFPKELGVPGDPVDISPRKAEKHFLRICVFNTLDTIMDETSITGDQMSDIYVKAWIEGMEHCTQKTDVHYRCMDGTGMFNWRFVFEFDYQPAEKVVSVRKKDHFWSLDEVETQYPPRLHIQVWDNDLISADDFLGSLTMDLTAMPQPSKTKRACSLKQLDFDPPELGPDANLPVSLFTFRRLRGMWPMQRDLDDGQGPQLTSKVEMEIEICDENEHAERAAGKARDEPNANPVLEPPNRPATSFFWFTSPWATFKHIIWSKYKWFFIGTLLTILVVLFFALFIYELPGAVADAII